MKNFLAIAIVLSLWTANCDQLSRQITYGADLQQTDLLANTLPVASDSKLARWHSGQVYFDGRWRSIEEVQQLVSTDPRWHEYRQRVDASNGSPESHTEIAYWCQRNGLSHEEKLHWLYVLQADPNHRGALKGLELIYYHGQLCPIDQVAHRKQQAKAAKQALNHYKPMFLILRRSAKSGSETERRAALEHLAAVSDPAAIPALADIAKLEFGNVDSPPNKSESAKKKPFELKLQQTVITALSNISSHEATMKLLEIAILSPYAEIRRSAAEALIPREKTSYMPLLMSYLVAPLDASINVRVSPLGIVRVSEDIQEFGPESNAVKNRLSKYITTSPARRDFTSSSARRDIGTGMSAPLVTRSTRSDYNKAHMHARHVQSEVAAENYSRHQWNTRIQEVLTNVVGQNLGYDPESWWDYWKDYNDLSYPKEKPTFTNSTYDVYHMSPYSCFAVGTPVWTQSGPAPIESIQIGDLVLSQDPITGCLDYRPVLQTTIRPPSPSTKLEFDDETIVATRGHRFWVIGDGWRMAKHLDAGDQLHGANSSSNLEVAKEGSEIEAFNLVVGEFHTYFVGKSRLLVHDNGCPQATTAIAPGVEPAVHAAR